jgi:hypothetical protein
MLAALLFMAIVIPVAVQGLQVASRASVVAQRKAVAARIAESLLNELVVSGQGLLGARDGTIEAASVEYRWVVRFDSWNPGQTPIQLVPMQLVTVEVTFPVQAQVYEVRLSTLIGTESSIANASPTLSSGSNPSQ